MVQPPRLRILMYHRFSDRAALARQCAHIRRHYQPVSMAAVSEWLHDGRSLPPYALAVTVDDGYADFREAATRLCRVWNSGHGFPGQRFSGRQIVAVV